MLKVIRLDKKEYRVNRYNNMYYINEALAKAEKIFFMEYIPSRKKLRKHLINIANDALEKKYGKGNFFPVSNKDIKRMERPRKFEIPVNIVDILDIIIKETISNKENFTYRASVGEDDIISQHALANTIYMLRAFKAWLDANDEGVRPECDKYREEVAYVAKRFEEFDELYPGLFNSLFE